MAFLALLITVSPLVCAAGAETVGRITLKLGEAWLLGPDGARRPAANGAAVHVGEAIETAASGHVHVRFRDDALVAVRPSTRLIILAYADPAAQGAVRFKLEHGQVRSITGRYGERDRSRFRLNTPIAAIGIIGTDFTVATDERLTRIAVASGGIVAAPFDANCRPDDLGPCSGERTRLLTAAMGDLMLEIRADGSAPILVPRNGLAAEAVRRVAEPPVSVAETVTQAQATEQISPLAQPPAQPATLAWGRWAHAPQWPGDTLARPREEAAAGRELVADNSRYGLYRLPQSEPLPASGVVTLGLAGAQAHLVRPDGVMPAQVQDGRLTLDFGARRFATQLNLSSQPTGQVPYAAAGAIAPDGTFSLIELQTRLKGAWGSGGSGPAAAYLFERATPQGMFMGITLWR